MVVVDEKGQNGLCSKEKGEAVWDERRRKTLTWPIIELKGLENLSVESGCLF